MYQALYRKYRPSTFDDVVGQQVIVKTLKNAVMRNEVSHAYMFFGPRGTGKTSIAKLLARVANCNDPKDGIPCESCANCNVSRETECMDIIEIDAASNNGVDEIRELRNKVNLVPNSLKYKVYIIDEVHMLTTGAFNALLKTLEEPPEHIIFILATTDPHKVPETIVSRCQCFNFKRINEQEIVKRLQLVVENEKIDIEEEVLLETARISDGGMRDSLGMLDKLKAYTTEKITLEDFTEINSLISRADLEEFVQLILKNDKKVLIEYIDLLNNKGKNLIQIMIQVLNYLRDEIVNAYVNGTKIDKNAYTQLASLINEKMIDIKLAENPKIFIEIMLICYLGKSEIISREIIYEETVVENSVKTVETAEKEEKTQESIEKPVEKVKEPVTVTVEEKITVRTKSDIKNLDEIINIRVNNTLASASKEELSKDQSIFDKLKEYVFDQKIGYLVASLLDGNIRASSINTIIISYEYESMVEKNLPHIEKLTSVLEELLNVNKTLALISNERWEKEKLEFIEKKKNGIAYEVKEEPEKVYIKNEEEEKFTEIVNLFSDIIEVE